MYIHHRRFMSRESRHHVFKTSSTLSCTQTSPLHSSIVCACVSVRKTRSRKYTAQSYQRLKRTQKTEWKKTWTETSVLTAHSWHIHLGTSDLLALTPLGKPSASAAHQKVSSTRLILTCEWLRRPTGLRKGQTPCGLEKWCVTATAGDFF